MYEKAQVNYENIELKAAYIEVDWNTKKCFSAGLRDSTGKLYGMPVLKKAMMNLKPIRCVIISAQRPARFIML